MQVVSVDDDGVGVVTDEGGAGPDLLSYGVRYAVDDRTYRREVQVTRDGGWVSGEWRIRGSLAQRADVALDSAIDHVDMRLGGLTTKVTQEAPPVVLYPGAYEVRLGGGRMMTFGTREVVVADEPVDLDVYATNDALGPAAMTAARDAAKDALTSCLSGGGTVVACDGGAISQSGDELGSSPT
ncbi:hypothetical protein [Janibacter sp. UYMM211]|uniref:hypothetical protein n=1 Tax=Janibacter sp. UYMM211 TaxID=3156342 RepID=UPI0033998607